MTLAADLQKLEVSNLITMFELDATALGGEISRFHNDSQYDGGDIVWQGNTYARHPLQSGGFEFTAKGKLPRPTLTVSNVLGTVGALLRLYNDLVGATVTRKRTLYKYLDAVNYPGGVNASADPSVYLPDDVYTIDRKAGENKMTVTFELASAMDVAGVFLPRRQIIQNTCAWVYKSAECGYVPGDLFKFDDTPTVDADEDVCGHRLSSCKARFGITTELPFGGFPGAGLTR